MNQELKQQLHSYFLTSIEAKSSIHPAGVSRTTPHTSSPKRGLPTSCSSHHTSSPGKRKTLYNSSWLVIMKGFGTFYGRLIFNHTCSIPVFCLVLTYCCFNECITSKAEPGAKLICYHLPPGRVSPPKQKDVPNRCPPCPQRIGGFVSQARDSN